MSFIMRWNGGRILIATAPASAQQQDLSRTSSYGHIGYLHYSCLSLYTLMPVCSFQDLFHCQYRFTAGRWEKENWSSHKTLYNSLVVAVILQVFFFFLPPSRNPLEHKIRFHTMVYFYNDPVLKSPSRRINQTNRGGKKRVFIVLRQSHHHSRIIVNKEGKNHFLVVLFFR